MSTQTYIKFLNENGPRFMKAKHGTSRDRREWESFEGSIDDRPGEEIELSDKDEAHVIRQTSDEYGGWIISVGDIPKKATHILIYRS